MKFNRSRRSYRLVAGFFLPPLLGSLLVSLIEIARLLKITPLPYNDIGAIFLALPFLFVFALIMVGIQSLVFSLAMEFVIRPCLFRNKIVLAVGGLFGFLSALPLAIGLSVPVLFSAIGIVVGVFVSWLIR